MELIRHLLLLGCCAALALSYYIPNNGNHTRGTESGGGIAPWAGYGPKPALQPDYIEDEASSEGGAASEGEAMSEDAAMSDPESFSTSAASLVPVGRIILRCTVPGTVALTFDDGPYPYTSLIMDRLRDAGMPATFFVNGDNWRYILSQESQALVRRMVAEGHQIGSHTWAHRDLATLDRDSIVSQMRLLESALQQILGYWPTYMRAPYFSTNDLVLRTMGELGYKVVHADIDTLDWANNSPDGIQVSVRRFRDGLNAGGSIALAHDVHEWTARTLTQAMIDEVRARGRRAVPVGECLGDPREFWYRR